MFNQWISKSISQVEKGSSLWKNIIKFSIFLGIKMGHVGTLLLVIDILKDDQENEKENFQFDNSEEEKKVIENMNSFIRNFDLNLTWIKPWDSPLASLIFLFYLFIYFLVIFFYYYYYYLLFIILITIFLCIFIIIIIIIIII